MVMRPRGQGKQIFGKKENIAALLVLGSFLQNQLVAPRDSQTIALAVVFDPNFRLALKQILRTEEGR